MCGNLKPNTAGLILLLLHFDIFTQTGDLVTGSVQDETRQVKLVYCELGIGLQWYHTYFSLVK